MVHHRTVCEQETGSVAVALVDQLANVLNGLMVVAHPSRNMASTCATLVPARRGGVRAHIPRSHCVTLGKEFGAAYVCPICDRAFDLPPIMRS
jgi:hypothetical protein